MIDASAFKAVVGRFATGVTVVTTRDEQGNLAGLTANAFASVSVDPPLVLVCLDEGSQTYGYLKDAGDFAVHILAEGQEHLARRFADSRAATRACSSTGGSGTTAPPRSATASHRWNAGSSTSTAGAIT